MKTPRLSSAQHAAIEAIRTLHPYWGGVASVGPRGLIPSATARSLARLGLVTILEGGTACVLAQNAY